MGRTSIELDIHTAQVVAELKTQYLCGELSTNWQPARLRRITCAAAFYDGKRGYSGGGGESRSAGARRGWPYRPPKRRACGDPPARYARCGLRSGQPTLPAGAI